MFLPLVPLVGMAWVAVTILLIATLIHRSIAGFREEDQLFLSAGDTALAAEQMRVTARMTRLTRVVHTLAWISGALMAVMVAVAAWVVARELGAF